MRFDVRSTWMLMVVMTGASVVWASDARSAGYWVRWSTCGGGVGADSATVDHTGSGPERVLLDDLLATPGIVWDDGQDDELVVRIATCEQAVMILGIGASGTDGATDGDAVPVLARELLTAQLNLAVNVEACPDVEHSMRTGEDLLDTLDFDGRSQPPGLRETSEPWSRPGDGYFEQALELAAELREFNLGRACAGPIDEGLTAPAVSPRRGGS